jgi:hypothetical protein
MKSEKYIIIKVKGCITIVSAKKFLKHSETIRTILIIIEAKIRVLFPDSRYAVNMVFIFFLSFIILFG